MGRRVVITGGAGFVGSHTVRRFLSAGDDVVVFDNLSSGSRDNLPLEEPNLQLIEGTILDTEGLAEVLAGADVVVHLAAEPSVFKSVNQPFETHTINYVGTLSVADACRRAGVPRMVYASSAAVYADAGSGAVVEDGKLAPSSPYGVDKLAGEYLLGSWNHLHGVDTVSLRLFNVYGERQQAGSPYSGVITIFVDSILNGRPVKVFGDGLQSRDFIYVGDVANAIYLAATGSTRGSLVLNVGTGVSTTLTDLIAALRDVNGGFPDVIQEAERRGDIRHSLASVAAIQNALGFESATPLREGLSALLSWAKSHTSA